MNRGVPPTAPKARTGELTPPGVTARAADLQTAVKRVYEAASAIGFEGAHYRRDIGGRPLKQGIA